MTYLKFCDTDFLLLFVTLLDLLEDMSGIEKLRVYFARSKVALAHDKDLS